MSRPYIPAANNIPDRKGGSIVIDSSNNILIVLQKNYIWSLPKGSQKERETGMIETAIRETKEETGLDLTDYESIDTLITHLHDSTYYFFVYKLPVLHTELTYLDTPIDSREFRWIPIDMIYRSIREKDINRLTKIMINQYILPNFSRNVSRGVRGGRRARNTKKQTHKLRKSKRRQTKKI